MADVALNWHDDFQVSSSGDLLVIDGDEEVRQRLQRRLYTAVNGYVWHPEYGAGLPQQIGNTLGVEQVKSLVASQLMLEASVATNPPATLTVTANPNDPSNVLIGIQYFDAITGVSVSFSITS